MKVINQTIELKELRLPSLPEWLREVDVIRGSFFINGNLLDNLIGCPKKVEGEFWCNGNRLTSLKGAPEIVHKDFSCRYNQLTSLEGCPKYVGGDFYCANNKRQFTHKDIRKVCKVNGKIHIKSNLRLG